MGKYLQMLASLNISQAAKQTPELTELSRCKFSQSPISQTELTEKSLNSVFSVPYQRPRKIFEIIKASEPLQLLDLMPDDLRWLENQLYWKSDSEKVSLLSQYQQMWLQAMADEPEATKQQAGRFAANSWMRSQTMVNRLNLVRI